MNERRRPELQRRAKTKEAGPADGWHPDTIKQRNEKCNVEFERLLDLHHPEKRTRAQEP